jgi:hypothetical protein
MANGINGELPCTPTEKALSRLAQRVHCEAYNVLLFGTVNPELTIRNGEAAFPIDVLQIDEEERLKIR